MQTGDHPKTYPWFSVLWLTGVDYFSTLGYQPGIALLAAGAIAPVATGILVAVTLLAAVPVYAEVARHSYIGQGSIAMLEHLLAGWWAKIFVLVLLGFAGTDFVITMTLSSADAAKHAVENPILQPWLSGHQIVITIVLLGLLAAVFLSGFREAIGLAIFVGLPYILLNVVVVARGALEIARHPNLFSRWTGALSLHGDLTGILIAAGLIFPKLALGLSGFETGVSVMPLIRDGEPGATGPPLGRIAGVQKLLLVAAVLMSFMLVGSSFVTTLLVPEAAYRVGGEANGRALAYLAHGLLGHTFGTVYDAVTIAILWFAGASAMAGLLNLVPRYLPRYGMAPRWVAHPRPLVLLFLGINIAVTLIFRADVDTQAGAYATGVLVLILSASVAVALALWKTRRGAAVYFVLVSAVFLYVLVDNVIERPDGVIIASFFIFLILATSSFSRYRRATELRVENLEFVDAESERLWGSIRGKKVNLVPLKHTGKMDSWEKVDEIRKRYRVEGPLAFLHVRLRDDRSEFEAALRVRVRVIPESGNLFIHVTGAVALANTIAFASEELDPLTLFLGLTRANPMSQAFRFLLWGEGETGILVYQILVRYWELTPDDDVRPLIFLVSD